jgi:succinate dehydrogenase hydrophobic anchor subunit
MFDHWKHFFHPHEGNDHRPLAYRAISGLALLFVVAGVLGITLFQSTAVYDSDRFLSSVLPSVLVDLTNEDRQDEGLQTLAKNKKLAEAAQMKANHMVENGYFAHDSPSGIQPWHWINKVGYSYKTAGENLAVDFSDSADVVDAWMDSKLHRENILETEFTEIGIATARGEYEGEETVYVVQMFANPSKTELASRRNGGTENNTEDDTADTTDESDVATLEPDQEDVSQQATDDTDTETNTDTDETSPGTSSADLVAQLAEETADLADSIEGTTSEANKKPDQSSQESRSAQPGEPATDTDTSQSDQLAQAPTAAEPGNQTEENGTSGVSTADNQPKTDSTTSERANRPTQTATTAPTSTKQESDDTTTNQQQNLVTTSLAQTDFPEPTAFGQVAGKTSFALTPRQYADNISHWLSQPEQVMQTVFLVLGGLILLALVISMAVEAKHHHFRQAVLTGIALLLLATTAAIVETHIFSNPVITSGGAAIGLQ